jgi:hypothetical protein
MLAKNPDFEFKFALASNFELKTAIDDNSALMATSSSLQVQMDNWTDFVVHAVQEGREEKSDLKPSDFLAQMHGAELTTWQTSLDKQKRISSSGIPIVVFDEAGNLKDVTMPFDSNQAHLVGLRTSKDCFQAP